MSDGPTYYARGGTVYTQVLGEETPLNFFTCSQRISRHRYDANFLRKSDPDRAAAEDDLADDLEEVMEEAKKQQANAA